MAKKVFVSGCYDLLHSGHVEFFRQAAQFGDLYVGIGSDATVLHYKNHKTLYPEQERLFMVKSIRYVKDAFINAGDGVMDFIPTVEALKPDIFVVNADGSYLALVVEDSSAFTSDSPEATNLKIRRG